MNEGDRIKARRKQLGMTQEELAQKAGYNSIASISKIERGDRSFPIEQIVPIAKALDVTPAWIMGWDKPESSESKTIDRLMAYAKKMNGLQFAEWLDYADKLLEEMPPDESEG